MHLVKQILAAISCASLLSLTTSGAAVDIDGNAVTNETALWDIDMSQTTVGDLKDAIAPDYVMVSNAAKNAVTTEQLATATNSIVGLSTNAAIKATSTLFRPLGDEQVYVSLGYSDFTYECDRQEVLDAIGDSQPYISYESGDYCEWYIDFNIGNTNYWGYAYVPKNAPEVTFSCDGWSWNDETGEESYDSVQVIGKRKANGYDIQDPIDTFAHQSEVTLMQAKLTSISNLVIGETKVLRTGKEGELGTGWGFLQSRIDDEHRYWRIQVPKISVQGLEAYSPSSIRNYQNSNGDAATIDLLTYTQRRVRFQNGNYTTNNSSYNTYWYPLKSNLLKKYPGWDTYGYVLRRTMGAYSTDKVIAASYRFGIIPESTNSTVFAANYDIDATVVSADNKQSFLITLDERNLLASGFTERYVGGVKSYYRAIEPIECNVTEVLTPNPFLITNHFSAVVNGIGIKVPQTNESWNGRSPYMVLPVYYDFDFSVVADCYVNNPNSSTNSYSNYTNYYSNILTNFTYSRSVEHALMEQNVRINYPGTISNSDYTFNTYEDRYAPYYKIVTTLDPYSHMYYDMMTDATFRINIFNGIYYSEKVCDGDWREIQGEFVPSNDVETIAYVVEDKFNRVGILEDDVAALKASISQTNSLIFTEIQAAKDIATSIGGGITSAIQDFDSRLSVWETKHSNTINSYYLWLLRLDRDVEALKAAVNSITNSVQ